MSLLHKHYFVRARNSDRNVQAIIKIYRFESPARAMHYFKEFANEELGQYKILEIRRIK